MIQQYYKVYIFIPPQFIILFKKYIPLTVAKLIFPVVTIVDTTQHTNNFLPGKLFWDLIAIFIIMYKLQNVINAPIVLMK